MKTKPTFIDGYIEGQEKAVIFMYKNFLTMDNEWSKKAAEYCKFVLEEFQLSKEIIEEESKE